MIFAVLGGLLLIAAAVTCFLYFRSPGKFTVKVTSSELREVLVSKEGAKAYFNTSHTFTSPVVLKQSQEPDRYEIEAMVAAVDEGRNPTAYNLPFGIGTVYKLHGRVKLFGHVFTSAISEPLVFRVQKPTPFSSSLQFVHVDGSGTVVTREGTEVPLSDEDSSKVLVKGSGVPQALSQPKRGDEYKPCNQNLAFRIDGVTCWFRGHEIASGTFEMLSLNNAEIPVVTKKIEDGGFIHTKDFGKIMIKPAGNLNREGIQVYLTTEQEKMLTDYHGSGNKSVTNEGTEMLPKSKPESSASFGTRNRKNRRTPISEVDKTPATTVPINKGPTETGLSSDTHQQQRELCDGQAVKGSITSSGGQQSWTFNATDGDVIRLQMTVTGGELWPAMRIYAPSSKLMNDVSAGSPSASIDVTVLNSGVHTIICIDGFNGAGTGTYNLSMIHISSSPSARTPSPEPQPSPVPAPAPTPPPSSVSVPVPTPITEPTPTPTPAPVVDSAVIEANAAWAALAADPFNATLLARLRQKADKLTDAEQSRYLAAYALGCHLNGNAKETAATMGLLNANADGARYRQLLSSDNLSEACAVCQARGTVTKPCLACQGGGRCSHCKGTGQVAFQFKGGTAPCPGCNSGACRACAGKGQLVGPCSACGGRGKTVTIERIRAIYLELLRTR